MFDKITHDLCDIPKPLICRPSIKNSELIHPGVLVHIDFSPTDIDQVDSLTASGVKRTN